MQTVRSRTGIQVEAMDLHFQGQPNLIASYLIRHSAGAIIIETGPGTTGTALEMELARRQLKPSDVTHVLLTHIHLDHAGGAGWMARHGAHIYVHPNGAPHMVDPEKLLKSAGRIYGDDMDRLWGSFLPVPESQLTTLEDGEEIAVGGVSLIALDTPGHAEHHLTYVLDDICFTGDVGGVRLPHCSVVVPPMPPPELDFDRWRESLGRIRAQKPGYLAPTHFGLFLDPDEHLQAVQDGLDAAQRWIEEVMPGDPTVEELQSLYTAWLKERVLSQGLKPDLWPAHELINPSWMSALGLRRYYQKKM